MKFLITGAGRGIGRGLTRILLARGHSVYLLDSNQAELQHTLGLCKGWAARYDDDGSSSNSSSSSNSQARFKGRLVDLSDRGALSPLVGDVGAFFGGSLDVLVNNAFATPHTWAEGRAMEDEHAEGDPGSTTTSSIEAEWDLKIAVGLTAPFLLARRLTPFLKAGRTGSWSPGGNNGGGSSSSDGGRGGVSPVPAESPGCIINISSTRAHMAEDDHEAYSAAKAGLLGLTQSMAVSLGHRHRIRVNAVVPGWIAVDDENLDADARNARWEDGLGDADHRWHPVGRVGRVDDMARTVLFLAESGFVTGEQITVDGGVTRKMVYPED